jgi:predicted DNA-binding transcriptional regulator YafY
MEWYEATLHVDNDSLEWIMSYGDATVLESDERGKTLRVRFPSFRAAVNQVAGWGGDVRVLDPQQLIQALADHARELLARYENAEILGKSAS